MQAVVQTERLTKRFGDTVALSELDLEIEVGQRVAIVGQPGAGKTTLVRILVDLIHPTSGRARVAGFDTTRASYQVRRVVGWVPADLRLPGELSVSTFLRRMADFKRSGADTSQRATVLARIDVAPDDNLRELSPDEQFVVAFLAALQKQPEVLIMDEPLAHAGNHRDLVVELLGGLPERTTVLATARDLTITDHVNERVLLLDSGRVVADGPLDTLRRRVRQRTELFFSSTPTEAAVRALPGVLDCVISDRMARVLSVGPTGVLVDRARALGLVDAVVFEPGLAELVSDHRLLASRS